MTSRGNYEMTNVRQLDSSQHMCSIVLVLSTNIITPHAKFGFNFKLQNIVHLFMEGLNLVAYSNTTKRCQLCLWEKYFIITANKEKRLSNRSELISKCLHEIKSLLSYN
jgi:hypothetical protein